MPKKATMKGGQRPSGPTTMKGGGNRSGGPTTMRTNGSKNTERTRGGRKTSSDIYRRNRG